MMVRGARSPVPNDKPKKSYLSKGPTKEQVERRNLLHGKLFGCDDGVDDPLAEDDDYLNNNNNDHNDRFKKVKKRMSRSLSPKGLKKRVLGRSRRRDNTTTKEGGDTATVAGRMRSLSLSPTKSTRKSTSNNSSPAKKAPNRWSLSSKSRRTKSADGMDDMIADMRESLRQQQQQQQQQKQRNNHNTTNGRLDNRKPPGGTLSENAKAEPSTMLERAAQRVLERRETLRKANKSDGDELKILQEAHQRKAAAALEAVTTSTKSPAIGEGIFSRGLQALEKMYDDIS
jgi:hypothetical protein